MMPPTARSLDADGGAGALEGGLRLVRGVLVDLLENRLRRAVDEVLGLLEAERRERADLLDDLDLLVADRVEDDVEFVLLLGGRGVCAGAGTGRGGDARHRDGGGGGDLAGLLELLHELRQLEEGHLLERVEQLVGAELRHGGVLSMSYTRGADADSTRPRALGGFVSPRWAGLSIRCRTRPLRALPHRMSPSHRRPAPRKRRPPPA